MVKVCCKDPTFGIVLETDDLFHQLWIQDVAQSKKTSIHSISSSGKTVSQNLRGAYIIALNDEAIFPKANAIKALAHIHAAKPKTFKITVGCLDKIMAKEVHHKQDDPLLHPERHFEPTSPDLELIKDEVAPPLSPGLPPLLLLMSAMLLLPLQAVVKAITSKS
jgi:hypothetical protein